ncbi:hypothetical protein Ahy_B01g055982 isoform A [Arachis hypogaea]|uniref:Uncharacterized protein n=1 Tax=Arachis hypogaea TaxID=3818 RepID=A0A445AXP8_ARAHY|nr:hypothetical protein Ahy_B01g055982 isoform A [Arachis hypogaea]
MTSFMVYSWIFKRSALLSSHNNPLQLSLQNPSSSLYSGTLPKDPLIRIWRRCRRFLCVSRLMEGPPMTFVVHHGGKFKKDEGGNLYYEPDHIEVLMGVKADTLDVFFVKGCYVELGYTEARECWWKSPGVPLEYGLRRLATDHDLVAMVKDCRRNFNLINLYFEHGVSEPCVVDKQVEDVPKIKPTQTKRHQSQPTKLPSHQKACSESTKASADGSRLSQPSKLPSQSRKFSTQSTKEPSQPSKLPTQPTKQPMQPTKPTGPSLKPTSPSAKPTRPTSKPSRPSSQPTKKSHHPVRTPSQQKKPYSQPTKPTLAPSQTKGKAKVTTTTRAGRHVKTVEVEEDSDSHDSYESAEDSLYKPPKVLGDDKSSSDSDDGVNSTRLNKKSEVKEKHKPAKTRLAEKEIETTDSNYEASEDEDESDSDLEDNPLDDNDSDLNSWHSEDSDQELDSDEESLTVYPQYNDKAKFGDLKFEVSMIFKSKEHFMHATRDYTIQLGRNILFTKNDNVRVKVVCKAEGCPWVVYYARSKQDRSWQIKTLVDNHICPRRRKNKAATQQWTLSKLVPKLRKHPTMRHREVYEWFVRKCNINLNNTCITRALKAARKVVEGDEVAQYGLI